MLLALIVSLIVIGGTVLVGLLGYLISRTAEHAGRKVERDQARKGIARKGIGRKGIER